LDLITRYYTVIRSGYWRKNPIAREVVDENLLKDGIQRVVNDL
jgi:hypothetical protein